MNLFDQWQEAIRKADKIEDKLFNPIRKKKENEVEITQYVRPTGEKRKMFAKVGGAIVKKAERLVFSAEVLPTGLVMIYAKRKGECEEAERSVLAEQNNMTNKLIELINSFGGKVK